MLLLMQQFHECAKVSETLRVNLHAYMYVEFSVLVLISPIC